MRAPAGGRGATAECREEALLTDGLHEVEYGAFSPEEASALARLQLAVWPCEGVTVEARAAALRASASADASPARARSTMTYICQDGVIVGMATCFLRAIETCRGRLTVLALAGVGSDPARRGLGLGRRVVQQVFAKVDRGDAPVCFFQTSAPVRLFYERLGCGVVGREVVNSLADDPGGDAFWDAVAMIYPATFDWPAGRIDLRGPGW